MSRQQEFVLRTLEERDIRFVRLWFTDIQGYLKSVAVAPAELEGAFEEGIGFDGSSIEGFSRVVESDTIARPDPSTFQILPLDNSDGSTNLTARMFCDIAMPDGEPSWADPRQVLRRQMNIAADQGFNCYIHPEIEFFLLKEENGPDGRPVPADTGGYFDQAVTDAAPQFRQDAITALESMGISVEFSHHEASPGQQEIDLRFADALSMADNIMSFRYIIKQIAKRNGVRATFMPKPFRDLTGSAMHTHMSLFEGETNAFHDPDDEYFLSGTAKSFIAGILEHAPEISAVTNQWVNSYKRVTSGAEAPTAATWGAANPYLTYAVLLAAGLKGIREGYELMPPAEEDIAHMTRRERMAMGYKDLPTDLDLALHEMEKSELVADALGEHVFEFFLRNKWREWKSYQSQVTPWELAHNLEF